MAFLGMRGTGDWATNERPEDWETQILALYPNGAATLTAIDSMMPKRKTEDPTFHWWTRGLDNQVATGTAGSFIYIDANCTTAYVYASHQATSGIAGATVYAKMTAADAAKFRAGHVVILRDASELSVDLRAKVTGKAVLNATHVAVALKLQEADDNGRTAATYNIATVDNVAVVGSYSPEGAAIPDAITTDPVEFYNYTGISRFPLSLTRTAIQTRLRTRDAYLDAKAEALLYFGIEHEKNIIFSIRSSSTGANGKPERTPMGLIEFIKTNGTAGKQYDDYRVNATYAGKTWKQGGEEWLDSMVMHLFAKGDGSMGGEKLVLCGPGALNGIQQLVKQSGNYQLKGADESYGIKVVKWETVHGTLNLKQYPLFAMDNALTYRMLALEPKNIQRRFIQPTMFKNDDSWKKGGIMSVDGLLEEFLCEDGYEFHHPETFQLLDGVGQDSVLS